MQGQVVMQMTNQVAVNQPTKVAVNAKTGNNANSNNAGSFASEFKNAADNISESNLGEAVTEQNVANILNVLAPIGLTNLIVNNLNAPVTESVKQQGIAEIGVVSAVPSTAQVQTNNFLLTSNNLNSEGSVEIKGQVDNNVELPLVDLKNDKEIIQTVQNKIPTNQVPAAISPVVTQQATSAETATLKPTQLPNNLQSSAENDVQIPDETAVKVPMVADNISESNLGEAVTEQNVANILNVLAPIGLTNLIVNNLNAPVTESVKQQGIAEIGVVSAVPSTAQVQTNNFLLTSNNLNSEGSVEIKGQVDNNVELPLVDLKNDKEIIQTVQNKIPTNQVPVAISPVLTQQATSAEISTLKPTQLPNNLQSSAENNVQISDETAVKVPMVAENIAPITVNKSNDVVKNNIVASADPVVTSTVASQDKINTTNTTNTTNTIAGTKDNQIKNVDTVDSQAIAVNPQVKPQGQNQSSAQSKQSFSGMMEQLPPTVQKSETISSNDIFAHNLDVSNKAVNTSGVEQVEKQLTTTEKMDIPNQIIQQTKVIKGIEDTQMVIKLKPEHLGELTLKFVLDKGAVSASFHSDNQQVRNIIESSLVQLKQELADQGIKISHMGVYAGLGDLLSNGQQEQRQSQQAKTKNRKADVTDFEDEVDKITNIKGVLSEDSVDYRI